MESATRLYGGFDLIKMNCGECSIRNAKSVASYKRSCTPSASYGGVNFAILLGSCGDDNLLERVSPPWYVIFPVSVTIICCLIIFFGGALFIEGKIRKSQYFLRD